MKLWEGLLAALPASLVGCDNDDQIYTLYRTSTLTPMRIHVASFDVGDESPTYNRGNCEMVVKYLVAQPEVPEGYYWCEQGRYRP